MAQIVRETNLEGLELIGRGKVRDIYAVDEYLLIVATDRISAFDVVFNEPIPYKGIILNQISLFWFNMTLDIVENHLITADVSEYPKVLDRYRDILEGRSMLVKRCMPIPVECVVRGYLAGSGWKDYKKSGSICGIELPEGLVLSQRLPEPIFTPATKAEAGLHDENIDEESTKQIIGEENFNIIKELSLKLYRFGSNYLEQHGIILADTKFEFGFYNNRIILIDECMTPDSSRFWPKDGYKVGVEQNSLDKQYLRNWLESLDWDKRPPAPALPEDIIKETQKRYLDIAKRITGEDLVERYGLFI